MNKSFSRGKVWLESARSNWDKRELDDSFVDATCFNLQQAIEFLIMCLVEMNDEKYFPEFKLVVQLDKLSSMGVSYHILDEIGERASLYSSWRDDTRYRDDFTVSSTEVEEAFQICDELCRYVKGYLDVMEQLRY